MLQRRLLLTADLKYEMYRVGFNAAVSRLPGTTVKTALTTVWFLDTFLATHDLVNRLRVFAGPDAEILAIDVGSDFAMTPNLGSLDSYLRYGMGGPFAGTLRPLRWPRVRLP